MDWFFSFVCSNVVFLISCVLRFSKFRFDFDFVAFWVSGLWPQLNQEPIFVGYVDLRLLVTVIVTRFISFKLIGAF